MKFYRTTLPEIIICEPHKIIDERGFFSETFRKDLLEDFAGYKLNFCQENTSESQFGVLRGLHFQIQPYAQTKLVSVSKGKILDVVVDIRKKSKNYGKNFTIELDDLEDKKVLVPKGFAHGFIVLSDYATVNYKVDNYYNSSSERGIKYNDSFLKIDWKLKNSSIITNFKDKNFPNFDSETYF